MHSPVKSQPNRALLAAVCISLIVSLAGCATPGARPATEPTAETAPATVRPAPAIITFVNSDDRFVVIDFSSRTMPAIGTSLPVFRGDRQVGTVRITEPVRGRLATGDILEGELRIGDEAR